MIYDCDYFIKKFEAIPEELWNDYSQYEPFNNTSCAYGHCMTIRNIYGGGERTAEGKALWDLFDKAGWGMYSGNYVTDVNNGRSTLYRQPTPKQRILAALYDIKKMQEPPKIPAKVVEQPVITSAPQRIVYVAIDAEVKKLGEEIVMS